MMQNKIILGLILLIAIAVVGLFFFGDKALAPVAEIGSLAKIQKSITVESESGEIEKAPPAAEATVTYTADGFTPQTLEIARGTKVIFKNESGNPMWVASAIHPTHSLYPQKSPTDCLGSSFDACDVTPHGASWSFTFNKVGSWGYHDHVRANIRGTVVVK